jgi:RNA polymerase sigma factor (TIGR02999 family)
MERSGSGNVTALLKAWRNGDSSAHDELIPLVYRELRALARHYRRKAGAGDTLQTTALVHEAYLKLVGVNNVEWRDRVHFFAVAAQIMRRILIDAARAQATLKRGEAADRRDVVVDWGEIPAPGGQSVEELLTLDSALTRLVAMDARRGRVVELHVFGGLTLEEIAEALGVAVITVHRDWRVAKAWLTQEMRS